MSTKDNFIAKIRDNIDYAIPDEEITAFDAEINEICDLFAENTDTFPDALVSCFVAKIKNTDEISKLESALPALQKELEESIAQYNASAKIPWYLSYGFASEEGNTIKKREDKIKKIQNNIIQKKQNIADSDVTRLGYLEGLKHFNTYILPLIQQLNKPEAEINGIKTTVIEHCLFIANPSKRKHLKEQRKKQLDDLQSSLADEITKRDNEAIKTQFEKAYGEAINKIAAFYGADYREIESSLDNENKALLNSLLKDLENSIQAEEKQKHLKLPVDNTKKQEALMSISVFMELRQTNSEMSKTFGLPIQFENMSREAKFQFICSLSKKLCSLDDNTQSEEFLKKELDEQEQTVLNIDTNPKIVLHAELAPRAEIAPPQNIDLNLEGVKAVVQDAAPFIILGFLPVGWAVRGIVGLGHVIQHSADIISQKFLGRVIRNAKGQISDVREFAEDELRSIKIIVEELAEDLPKRILYRLPLMGFVNDLSAFADTLRNYAIYLFSNEDTRTRLDIALKWGIAAVNLTIALSLIFTPLYLITHLIILPFFKLSLLSFLTNTVVAGGSIAGVFIAGKTIINALDKNKDRIKFTLRKWMSYIIEPEQFKVTGNAKIKYDADHLKKLKNFFKKEIFDSQVRLYNIQRQFNYIDNAAPNSRNNPVYIDAFNQFKRSANDLIILKADLKAIGEAKGENDKAYKEKFAEYEQLRDQYIKLRVAVEKLDHQIQRVERLDPNREMLSYKDDPRYKQECIVYKNLCECWEKIRLGELNTLQDVHGYLSNIYQAQLPEVENMVQLEKDLIQEDAVIVTLDNIRKTHRALSAAVDSEAVNQDYTLFGRPFLPAPFYEKHRTKLDPTLQHLTDVNSSAREACDKIKGLSFIVTELESLPRARRH